MKKYFYKIIETTLKKFSKIISYKYVNKKKFFDIMPTKRERISDLECKNLSKGIKFNNSFLAGNKIKFQTNSKLLKIEIFYNNRVSLNHMSNIATSGIDIYEVIEENFKWHGTIFPNNNITMKAKGRINLGEGNHKLIIYLPPFAEIKHIYVKNDKEKYFEKINEENNNIVVYGSSITQGCAASRPALSYTNILSRFINNNILNFGFSESARGEQKIIEYLANINAKVYILEYDHNSEVKELKENHKKMYVNIRNKNKESKIIFLSRMSGEISISKEEEQERIQIINSTYQYALENGDANVFFLNGSKLLKDKELYFTDSKHPNDAGMIILARNLYNIIEKENKK